MSRASTTGLKSAVFTTNASKKNRKQLTRARLREAVRGVVEQLEDRRLLSVAQTWVNDNWTFAFDTDGDGHLSSGDLVSDPALGATPRTYGVNAFGHVTTGSPDSVTSLASADEINEAIANTNSGGKVTVLGGSYDENIVIGHAMVLEGGVGGVTTLTKTTGATGQALVQVNASNVTVQNMTFAVDQAHAVAGIVMNPTSVNLYSNLSVLNNNFTISGTYVAHAADAYVGFDTGSTAIAVKNDGPTTSLITITGNNILPTIVGGNISAVFDRAIYLRTVGGTVSNNNITGDAHDLAAQFVRAPFTVSNNQFNGYGGRDTKGAQVDITEAEGAVNITGNVFTPQAGVSPSGSTHVRSLMIKNSANPTTISGNTFNVSEVGVLAANSAGTVITGNTFTPVSGDTAFTDIQISNKVPTGGTIAPRTNSATISGNTFGGSGSAGGTAVQFLNHNSTPTPGGGLFGPLAVTGNSFAADLAKFIVLDGSSGSSTTSGLPNYNIYGATTMAPFAANVTATGNSFDVGTGLKLSTTMTVDELFAVEDKIDHATDNANLGFVQVNAGNVYVTQNSGSIQRGVNVADAGDTVHVGAGTFINQVEISKNLDLVGEGATTVIKSPLSDPLGFVTTYNGATLHPVVYVHGANAVNISSLTVDGDAQGGGNNRLVGIGYYNAGGTIDQVTVQHVRDNPLNGVQAGTGVFAHNDDSVARTINITNSTFSDIQKGDIVINGNGLTGNVTGNTINGVGPTTAIAQNGVQISRGAGGNISGNTISGFSYTTDPQSAGILVFDNVNVTVDNNVINGSDTGVYIENRAGFTTTVTNNRFNTGATDNGIDIDVETPGAVIGVGNKFGAADYFIWNGSTTNYDLTGYTATNFDGLTNNYRIEDKMYHKVDDVTSGLITWVANNVYVSAPGTGANNETIQGGVNAASDGDTVNLESGTHAVTAPVNVNKPITILGEAAGTVTVTAGAALGAFPAALFRIGGGTLDSAADNVTLQNISFDGNAGGFSAVYGVYVDPTANLGTLTVSNGAFNDLTIGIYVEGYATTGLSARKIDLEDLTFAGNGGTGGGTGDISTFNYNGDATLKNLTMVGTGSVYPAQAIQLRGVGNQDGSGQLAMGRVIFDNVDVSGVYDRSFITIQRYNNVGNGTTTGLSFNDVKIGGATSKLTGVQPPSGSVFGSLLRFDSVGAGTLGAAQTVDLGNMWFRGLDPTSTLTSTIEFSPDSFGFLYADATQTKWTGSFGTKLASDLSVADAMLVERDIYDYLDVLPGGAYFHGYVKLQDGQVFVASAGNIAQPTGSIQHGIQVAGIGDTVNVGAGSFTENITVDHRITLAGAGSGSNPASNTVLTGAVANTPVVSITAGGSSNTVRQVVKDLRVVGYSGGTGDNIQVVEGANPISHVTLQNVASINATDDAIELNYTTAMSDIVIDTPDLENAVNNGILLKKNAANATFDGIQVLGGTIRDNRGSGFISGYLDSYGVDHITIDGTNFTGNGWQTGQNFGNVMLNKFSGTADISNVSVTSTGLNGSGTYGFNINGQGDTDVAHIHVNNVNVSGAFRKVGFLVQEYTNVSDFTLNNLDVRNATSSTSGWYSLAIGHSDAVNTFHLGNTKATQLQLWGSGNVDAASAQFYTSGNVLLDKNVLADNFRIEDAVVHKLDDGTLGLVTWNAGQLYVTAPGTGAAGETIQRAINAATDGNTINVEAGTYNESVTLNKKVTLKGAGATATIINAGGAATGLVLAASGASASDRLIVQDLGVTGASNSGIQDSGGQSYITLSNVNSSGNTINGLQVINLNDLVLNNVSLTSNQNGFRMGTAAHLNGLTVTGGHFDNNQYGFEAYATSSNVANQNDLTNVSITGATFNNNVYKGLYVEKLNNAVFDGVTVSGSGFGTDQVQSAGFDINLKYGTYSGIEIKNSTFTGDGTGDTVTGAAIAIKARSDAPSYSSNPATVTGVSIHNNFIDNNEGGIRLGEPGKNNPGPTGTTINNNHISGNTLFGLNNQTTAAVNAESNWWGQAAGPNIASNLAIGTMGDAITGPGAGLVDYSPWLTDGSDTSGATGFQPGAVDTTAPATPGKPDLTTDSQDPNATPLIGTTSDDITNVATPSFDVAYAGETPVTLQLLVDGTVVASMVVNGPDTYSLTSSALGNGQHVITSRATDTAGNIGAESDALSITVDTSAPNAPSAPDLLASSDSFDAGIGTSSDNYTSVKTPTFSGTAEAGSLVRLYANGNEVGWTLADGTTGAWSITSTTLGDGTYNFKATATDTAGNVSADSTPLTVVIVDATKPDAPSTPDLDSGSDSRDPNATPHIGTTSDDITNDNTPTFTGTGEEGSLIRLYAKKGTDAAVQIGTATVSSGTWSITSTVSLTDGVYAITATATDLAGNVSDASGSLSVTIDTSAPGKPGAADLDTTSDTRDPNATPHIGTTSDDNTKINTPSFSGTAEAGSLVRLYADGNEVGWAIADGTSGAWTITSSTLGDGDHLITVTATDTAGNVSAASDALSVHIDTAAPAKPGTPDMTDASDTFASNIGTNQDNITSNNTPTFTGTAEAGSLIRLYADGNEVGWVIADGTSGAWSITSTTLGDGSHDITATATDTAGNVSVASDALSIFIDTSTPVPNASGNHTVNEGTLTTLDASYTDATSTGAHAFHWTVVNDNTDVVAEGFNEDFTFTPHDNGTYTFTWTVTDSAGNSASQQSVVTVNNVAPSAVTFTLPASVNEGSQATASIGTVTDAGSLDTFTYSYVVKKKIGSNPATVFATSGGFIAGTSFQFTPDDMDPGIVWTVEVQARDDDGGLSPVVTQTLNVVDVPPTVYVESVTTPVNEMSVTTLVFHLVDPGTGDLASVGQVVVNWGDGTLPTVINSGANLTNLQSGNAATVTHTYTDDSTAVTSSDNFNISFSAYQVSEDLTTDPMALATGSVTPTVTVNNVAPTGTFLTSTPTVNAGSPGAVNWIAQNDVSPQDVSSGFRYIYFIDVNGDGAFDVGTDTLITGGGTGTTYAQATTASSFTIPGSYFTNPGVYNISSWIIDNDNGHTAATRQITVAAVSFRVSSMTATASGFDLTFNRAFDASTINLYAEDNTTPADITVLRDGVAVKGSLVFTGPNTLSFVATGGILADGNYTVTVRSDATGFKDGNGQLLDGNSDGTSGDNFTGTFSVSNSGLRYLYLPDFVRGPGQLIEMPPTSAANTIAALPLKVSAGAGVSSIDFTLDYDTRLITIDTSHPFISLADGSFTFDSGSNSWVYNGTWSYAISFTSLGGTMVRMTVTGAGNTIAGDTIAVLNASVPYGATYGSAQALKLGNVEINGVTGLGDSAVQVYAYMADLNGSYNGVAANSVYSSADVTLLQRRTVLQISGYNFYNDIDPLIVSDINLSGTLSSADATLLQQRIVAPNGTASLPKVQTPPSGSSLTAPLTGTITLTNIVAAPVALPADTVQAPSTGSTLLQSTATTTGTTAPAQSATSSGDLSSGGSTLLSAPATVTTQPTVISVVDAQPVQLYTATAVVQSTGGAVLASTGTTSTSAATSTTSGGTSSKTTTVTTTKGQKAASSSTVKAVKQATALFSDKRIK